MKINILNIVALGALLLGASSCDEGWTPQTSEEGSVKLSSMTIELSDAEKVINTSSRGQIDISNIRVENFKVKVSNQNGNSAPKEFIFGEMPEVLVLPVGTYNLEVESHEVKPAEWDAPYFKGSTSFEITNGKITQIGSVEAKFASLKVSVVFDADLRAVLSNDATVTISANDRGQLVYKVDEQRAGYFEVIDNSMTMIAHFEGSIDGVYTVQDTPFTDVEPGQHRIITYSTKRGPEIPEQSGNIDPSEGLFVDVEVANGGTINGNVTPSEDATTPTDRPGQEEPQESPNPGPGDDEPSAPAATFEATNSPNLKLDDINMVSDFPEGEVPAGNAIVTIHCEKKIQHLVVTISTTDDGFADIIDEMKLKSFDLAYPGDAEDNIKSLELAYGDQVINKQEVEFNITQFVSLLANFSGTHTFNITVTDNEGKKASLDLRFKADN
ncbi:MAG: DUF4493 domain-containing protein [Muribaculaceae bacterium]|nr:DUF4493 domain-containing protein [Muribaculaceae bacterium]